MRTQQPHAGMSKRGNTGGRPPPHHVSQRQHRLRRRRPSHRFPHRRPCHRPLPPPPHPSSPPPPRSTPRLVVSESRATATCASRRRGPRRHVYRRRSCRPLVGRRRFNGPCRTLSHSVFPELGSDLKQQRTARLCFSRRCSRSSAARSVVRDVDDEDGKFSLPVCGADRCVILDLRVCYLWNRVVCGHHTDDTRCTPPPLSPRV